MQMHLAWELPCDGSSFNPMTLQVSEDERERISKLKQGSQDWLRARYGRLTASNFGAAAGHHVSSGARRKLLEAMLWPESHRLSGFAAKFAAYGTEHEAVARQVYVADRVRGGASGLRVRETGLLVSLEHGWLGSSPDFIVEEASDAHERPVGSVTNPHHCRAPYSIMHPDGAQRFIDASGLTEAEEAGEGKKVATTRGCGEIKCPATKLLYSHSDKHATYAFPAYYYDQIQGVMAINNWPWCDTVVYTPYVTEVIRFHANPVYWETELLPKLRKFYFDDFLPRLNLRVQGVLKRGEVDQRLVIPPCVLGLGLEMTLANNEKEKNKKRKRENEKKTKKV